jgi:hypothetical protein
MNHVLVKQTNEQKNDEHPCCGCMYIGDGEDYSCISQSRKCSVEGDIYIPKKVSA